MLGTVVKVGYFVSTGILWLFIIYRGICLTWNGGPDGDDVTRLKYKAHIIYACLGILLISLLFYMCNNFFIK